MAVPIQPGNGFVFSPVHRTRPRDADWMGEGSVFHPPLSMSACLTRVISLRIYRSVDWAMEPRSLAHAAQSFRGQFAKKGGRV